MNALVCRRRYRPVRASSPERVVAHAVLRWTTERRCFQKGRVYSTWRRRSLLGTAFRVYFVEREPRHSATREDDEALKHSVDMSLPGIGEDFSHLDTIIAELPELFYAEILPKLDLKDSPQLGAGEQNVQRRGVERRRRSVDEARMRTTIPSLPVSTCGDPIYVRRCTWR